MAAAGGSSALAAVGGRACLHGAALRQTHFLCDAVGAPGLQWPHVTSSGSIGGRIQPWGQQAANLPSRTLLQGASSSQLPTERLGPPAGMAIVQGATTPSPSSVTGMLHARILHWEYHPATLCHLPTYLGGGFHWSRPSIIFSNCFSAAWPWRDLCPCPRLELVLSHQAVKSPHAQLQVMPHGRELWVCGAQGVRGQQGAGCQQGAGSSWMEAGTVFPQLQQHYLPTHPPQPHSW